MILECSAVYHGKTDLLQVAAFMSEDDGVTSVQRLIKTGTVSIFHNTEEIYQVEFDQRSYNKTDNEGVYLFFYHPPLRTQLRAQVSVELYDGRSAKTSKAVENDVVVQRRQEEFANPSLANRPVIDHSGRKVELL